MIRVYFDWNIITELKKPDGGKHAGIKGLIEKHRAALLTPFSNYHVEDLIKNNKTKERLDTFVKRDLEYLEELSQNHFLGEDAKGNVLAQIGSPLKFLDTIEEDEACIEELLDMENILSSFDALDLGEDQIKLSDVFKNIYKLQPVPEDIKEMPSAPLVAKFFPNLDQAENYWDIIKDFGNFNKSLFSDKNFLKEYRLGVQEVSLELEANPGTWETDNVIENITKGLHTKGIKTTFSELIESSLKYQKNVTRSLHFCTAYLMLDFYGYQSDKLPKPTNSFQNITNDAHHSFLAAHCDILVSEDKALIAKSKVLYKEYSVNTLVLTAKEFEEQIEGLIHYPIGNPNDAFQHAIEFLNNDNFLESARNEGENILLRDIFKLPMFYFNYFNYLIYEKVEEGLSMLTFRKVYKNYSDFVYYTENIQLLKKLFECLGQPNDNLSYDEVEKELVFSQNTELKNIIWSFDEVHFIIRREIKESKLCLIIVVNNKNSETPPVDT